MPSPGLERELRLVDPAVGALADTCDWCGPTASRLEQVEEFRLCETCSRKHGWGALPPELARRRLLANRERSLATLAAVPKRYAKPFQAPDAWPTDRAGISLEDWPGREEWSALLIGPVGAGKTFLAVELLWRELVAGRSAAFVRAAEIPALSIGNRMPCPDLLLVDDLGIGHSGGGWEVVSRELLGRYDREQQTVITTRLRRAGYQPASGAYVPGIADHDASLGDRLRDGMVFAVNGPSRRGG